MKCPCLKSGTRCEQGTVDHADYRTLVSVSEDGLWKCHYDACKTVQGSRMRSTTCSDIQRDAFSGECEHVRKVQKESPLQQSLYHTLHVNTSTLQSLPFPPSVKEELQAMREEFSTGIIQRISEETFLVRDVKRTQEHQFGVLHMRFPKPAVTYDLVGLACETMYDH